jgi:hypothetical protein
LLDAIRKGKEEDRDGEKGPQQEAKITLGATAKGLVISMYGIKQIKVRCHLNNRRSRPSTIYL